MVMLRTCDCPLCELRRYVEAKPERTQRAHDLVAALEEAERIRKRWVARIYRCLLGLALVLSSAALLVALLKD